MSERSEERIENLQKLYVDDEIDEPTFDELCEAALNDEPPYHRTWFLNQLGVHSTASRNDSWCLYRGRKFVVDGERIVPVEEES